MRELFETMIERLFADLATPAYVLGCEGGEWPAELWSALDESGFTLAGTAEALGGAVFKSISSLVCPLSCIRFATGAAHIFPRGKLC